MIFSFVYVFIIRILESILCTYRTILIVNKNKKKAFVIAFIEIVVWLIAMKTIITRNFDALSTISYALGFSLGTYFGVAFTAKFSKKRVYLIIKKVENYEKITSNLEKYNYEIYKTETGFYTIVIDVLEKEITNITEKIMENNEKLILNTIDYKRV